MGSKSSERESCLLPQSPAAPAVARRFVETTLTSWGMSDSFGDVPLLTSELVTNAVRHAGGDVELSIDLAPHRVRVEVQDQSAAVPVKGDLAAARDGGWGLHIVERLSTRWGLEHRNGGKTVWCEVEIPGR